MGMKIGIEGQRLFRERKHGMDMVALQLIRNIQVLDKENEYVIFVKKGNDRCLTSTENVKIIEFAGGPFPLWEQLALPLMAKKHRCDILHCTSNTAPLFGSIPLILTLHDIFFLETFSLLQKSFSLYQRFGNVYRRFLVPLIVRKAKEIITVSNSEKERIVNFFRLDNSRITVIYNGVDERFHSAPSGDACSRVREYYNLPEKYIFFLGNTDPKKNTEGVLKAYLRFLEKYPEKIPLVIGDFPEKLLLKELKRNHGLHARDHIHRLDYIKHTDLCAIYSSAEIFLYPSLRESFGIPQLEAMYCGTPVITSNVFSMPEIAEDAALLVNPKDPEEIAEAIHRLLVDKSLRESLIAKGFLQAQKYSWKKMAEKVLLIYRK